MGGQLVELLIERTLFRSCLGAGLVPGVFAPSLLTTQALLVSPFSKQLAHKFMYKQSKLMSALCIHLLLC